MSMPTPVLDVQDVAVMLKVGPKVVREAVKQGHLKRLPIGGPRTWRFREADVLAYVDWLAANADELVEQADAPAPEAVVTLGRGRRRVHVN